MGLPTNYLASALMAIAAASGADAQAPQILHHWWRTDKDVATVEFDPPNNRVLIGGEFHYVGPPENYLSRIDANTAVPDPSVDHPNDRVLCAADDGAGGWYLGGEFTKVGGEVRQRLAHVDANGHVTDWSPAATNLVQRMWREGSTIFIYGWFTAINGTTRDHFAALDATSGDLLPWSPGIEDPNFGVEDLLVHNGTVYLCGTFEDLNGVARAGLGAFDGLTGATTDWAPIPTGAVRCLAAKGDTVFVGGVFSAIEGVQRPYLASILTSDGSLTTWDPQVVGAVNNMLVVGNKLYLMGGVASVGGQVRSGFGAVDPQTGAPFPWAPMVEEGGLLEGCMDQANGLIYAGGAFMKIDGQQRIRLAAFDAETGALTDWSPGANHPVVGIQVSGSYVLATGLFTSTCGKTRNGVAALDLATGAATDWDAHIETQNPVLSIHATPDRVYVGGLFNEVAGEERDHVAAVDAVTGALDPWNPGANNRVWAIGEYDGRVFIGGQFDSLGGAARTGVGAVDIDTGVLDTWAPDLDNSSVTVFAFGGDTVFMGGGFYSINGEDRARVAALDANTGELFPWSANVDPVGGPMRDLLLVGSTLYLAGWFNAVGGQSRAGFAAVDRTTALPTAWNPADTLSSGYGLALTQGFVHIGGYLTIAGQEAKMVSTDPLTGVSQNWIVNPNGIMSDFDAVGNIAILAGWLNDRIDNEPVEYYAAYEFDFHTGEAADEAISQPLPICFPNPGDGRFRLVGSIARVRDVLVMDMQGKLVRRFPVAREADLTTLPDAAYVIALAERDGTVLARTVYVKD